jgi:hypothetical protein
MGVEPEKVLAEADVLWNGDVWFRNTLRCIPAKDFSHPSGISMHFPHFSGGIIFPELGVDEKVIQSPNVRSEG